MYGIGLGGKFMKAVIVFNHPYEKSFCSAILEAVKKD